jgi:hypothetical protein
VAKGNGVVIAILEDGVLPTHEDIEPNLLAYDNTTTFPSSNLATHGTAVTSVAIAPVNGKGIAGVAHQAKAVVIKAAGTQLTTFAEILWITTALDKAWQQYNAQVILSALFTFINEGTEINAYNDAINRAATQGRNGLGCVIVMSSGNRSFAFFNELARNPNVIAVGGSTNQDARSSASSYGSTNLSVVAPGQTIPTADDVAPVNGVRLNNQYGTYTGTSFAAPMVAGATAATWPRAANMPR